LYLNKRKFKNKIKRFKNRKTQKLIFDFSYNIIHNPYNAMFNIHYLYIKNKLFLNLKFYKIMLFKMRRVSRRKKLKAYININCNHNFSRKSKNSRMGKGKGKFRKFVFRVKTLKPLVVFFRTSIIRIKKLVFLLNKKTKGKFFIILNKIFLSGYLNSFLKIKKNKNFNTGFFNLLFFFFILKKIFHNMDVLIYLNFFKKKSIHISLLKSAFKYNISKHSVNLLKNKYLLTIKFGNKFINYFYYLDIFKNLGIMSVGYLNLRYIQLNYFYSNKNFFLII